MRQKSGPKKQAAENAIRDIRRATRRHFSAEERIRIVLEGLRDEESIAELCRREGIASSMYYGWSGASCLLEPVPAPGSSSEAQLAVWIADFRAQQSDVESDPRRYTPARIGAEAPACQLLTSIRSPHPG
jgi:transposase